MADFYQNGIVTTMHNLGQRSNQDLEAELKTFSSTRPMGLILPSLFSEFRHKTSKRMTTKHLQYLCGWKNAGGICKDKIPRLSGGDWSTSTL